LMLSEIALGNDDIHHAQTYLTRMVLIPSMPEYAERAMHYYQLSAKVNEANHDFKQANIFNQKYIDINAKLSAAKLRNKLMNIQTQFAEKQNLERIQSQTTLLSMQEQSIKNQRLLNISFAVSFALIVWLVVILVKRVREKQKINNVLDARVRERTIELEKNRDDLMHSHNEQALVLKKVTSDLVASLATIKGLSEIPNDELQKNQVLFVNEAQSMTERISDYLNNHQSIVK